MIILGKKIRRVIEKIKNDLKQIIIREKRKISFAQMTRIFFEKKKISFVCLIRFLTISFVHMTIVVFIRINKALENIELQGEKIVEKIGKEIFIKE